MRDFSRGKVRFIQRLTINGARCYKFSATEFFPDEYAIEIAFPILLMLQMSMAITTVSMILFDEKFLPLPTSQSRVVHNLREWDSHFLNTLHSFLSTYTHILIRSSSCPNLNIFPVDRNTSRTQKPHRQ